MRARPIVAALVVMAMLSGCSFIGVRGPSPTKLDCTDKFGLPVFDTVIFAAATAAAVSVFYASATAKPCTGECGDGPDLAAGYALVVGAPTALLAMLYGTSAASGYSTVAQCNSSKRELKKRSDDLLVEVGETARAGDCVRARALFADLVVVDRKLKRNQTTRDAAILRCLRESDARPSAPPAGLPEPTTGAAAATDCAARRGNRIRAAEQIADHNERIKALLAIPLCEPVPGRNPTAPAPAPVTTPAPPAAPPEAPP